MNWDTIEGNWKQMEGKAKKRWSKLTDDEIDKTEGHRDVLDGKLQERCSMQKGEVEREINDWERSL